MAVVCASLGVNAQRRSSSSSSSSEKSNGSPSKSASDKKSYPPGTAWHISDPLGIKIDSTLDTLLYNYQRTFVSALGSDAWATTGQFTGPALNMIYFQRESPSAFLFDNALEYWLPSFGKQKFFNVYVPYTQLSYGMGYGTEDRTDHLNAVFAGNINRSAGIGAWINYPYTKGAYANQAAKGLGFGFSGYYDGPRYEMQAFFNHYNHLNKENGGITNDLYITDPAKLQGGVNEIDPKTIPTNLNSAHSRLIGSEFYMSHAYKVGFWEDITQPEDTVEKKRYVPVTKFIYSLDWQDHHHMFLNKSASDASKFWQHSYFNTEGTRDNTYNWTLTNSVGIEMIEGFRKWAKFGLSAYVSYELSRYRFAPEGLDLANPETSATQLGLIGGDESNLRHMIHRVFIGGRIAKSKGAVIRYHADAKFGVVGDVAGDVDVTGHLDTKFRLGKDTVRIEAEGRFANLEPDYLCRRYIGNHFIWDNHFGKERIFRAEGKLTVPWTRTLLGAAVENLQNKVYFGPQSTPLQYSGNVQVVSAWIDQQLKFGIWNWNNTLTWQKSSNSAVVPLPALALYSNMFLSFKAFRALEVQVGVDCNWYSKYKGLAYQPATMTFHTQGSDGVDVGNFIFSDVYLTAKLYQVRFFLMCSHLNQGWFSKDYFSLPHYPVDPRQFRFGLSIEFAN